MGDALSSLLHDVQPRGALFDRSLLNPPWSRRSAEQFPLTLRTMLSGEAWVLRDGHQPVHLRPLDVTLVVGPEPLSVADAPATAPMAVVHDDGSCTTPSGQH